MAEAPHSTRGPHAHSWFSINQDDVSLKSKGVSSLISYTTNCTYMLVPLDRPLVEAKVTFAEQIPVYGGRAWCRLEFFCFSCLCASLLVSILASPEPLSLPCLSNRCLPLAS